MGLRNIGSYCLLFGGLACSGVDGLPEARDDAPVPGESPLGLPPPPGQSEPPPPGPPPSQFTSVLGFHPTAFLVSGSLLYYIKKTSNGFGSSVYRRDLSTNSTDQLWTDANKRAAGLALYHSELFFAVGCSVMHVQASGGTTYLLKNFSDLSACYPGPRSLMAVNRGFDAGLYWGSAGLDGLWRIDQSGPFTLWTTHQLLSDFESSDVCAPAMGAGYLFYIDEYDGDLQRLPVGGGQEVKLAEAPVECAPVATDGNSVFYRNAADHVASVPVGGGSSTTFATSNPSDMVVADGYLYFSCASCGKVQKKPLAGGSTTTLASGLTNPSQIQVTTDALWVASDGALRMYSK